MGNSRIAVEFQGIVWAQLDRCSISGTSLVTSRIAGKSLGKILGTGRAAVESLERGLGTSRIAVKSLARVWGPAGWL